MLKAEEQLAELKRGAAEILLEAELLTKLRRGQPLRWDVIIPPLINQA
jgi:tyrosyl-tRNA synthetase